MWAWGERPLSGSSPGGAGVAPRPGQLASSRSSGRSEARYPAGIRPPPGPGAPAGHPDPRRPAGVSQDDRLLRQPPWGSEGPVLHVLRAARRLRAGLELARGHALSAQAARAGLGVQSGNTRQLLLAVATSRPAPSWISAAASATRRPGLVTRPTATRVPLSTVTGRR